MSREYLYEKQFDILMNDAILNLNASENAINNDKYSEMERFARSTIFNITLLLESAANCCLETLRLPSQYYKDIDRLIFDDESLGELIPGSDEAIKAELLYSIKEEFTYNLSDLILRRTDIGSLGKPDDETINFCAAFMGKEMGWSESERREQISGFLDNYKRIGIE